MSDNSHQKFIDTRLPLWWLIGSSCAVVFTMGVSMANFTAVQANMKKIETKIENLDSKIQSIGTQLTQSQGRDESQDIRLNYLYNELRGQMKNHSDQEHQ